MLLAIRENAQSWIMWIIIIFLILMFGLWGISYYLTGTNPSDRAVVTVNGQSIPNYRFQSAYDFLKQKSGLLAPSEAQQIMLKQEALKQLINKTIMVQEAQNLGMSVRQQDIDALIYQLPAFQYNGKFDPRLLQMYLQSIGMNEHELQNDLFEDLMASQLTRGIILSQFLLPNEIHHFAQLMTQQRNVRYHVISAHDFRDHVHISNVEIESYYRVHQQDFMTTPRIRVAYIDLSLDAMKKDIKPTETDLISFYQNHADQFRLTGKRRGEVMLVSSLLGISNVHLMTVAQKVATQWRQGKPMNHMRDELTRQHIILSQTPIAWVRWNKQQNKLQAALFALKNNGQVSQPIVTDKGIALVKLTTIETGQLRSYQQVKQTVRSTYIQKQAQQRLSRMANQLANITFEHNRGLTAAAHALNIPVQTTGYVTKNGMHQGILANKKVIDVLFRPDVLIHGNNSDLIQISPQEVAVVRVVDYQPAKVKPLNKIRSHIVAVLTQQDSTRLAMHQASKLVEAVRKNPTAYHINSWHTKQLTRKSTEVDKALLASVFVSGMPKQQRPVIFASRLSDGNVAVVKLLSVSNKPLSTINQPFYQSALNQLYTVTLLNGFVEAAKHRATIQHADNVQITSKVRH